MAKKTEAEIQKAILGYLEKQEWPSTTEDIAAGCSLSWNTCQLHLVKLQAQSKVKYRKVGRQNQWWMDYKYRREMT